MKPCCIIGFLLSGNAVVPQAPSGPLSSVPVFSIADVMIWIRNVQGLWEIAVLCRLSSCSGGMLNTQESIKSSKSWDQARDLQVSLSGLREADGPVALCSRFASCCMFANFPGQNSHTGNLVQAIRLI